MRGSALCAVSVSVLCLSYAPGAHAQAQADKTKKVQIEEITVTAERREESAQDIGSAIEAFSTTDLDRRGITDIYDLSSAVPSLQVTGGLPQPTLRGVSSDIVSPGVDAPFAAHINGQYVPQLAVALLPFLDIERVEVLYGPQGTLFGHATTGGTLNFITALPKNDFEVQGEADVATYDRASVTTSINVPLVPEKVLSRLAYRHGWPSRAMDVDHGHNDGLSTQSLSAGDAARLTFSFLPQDNVRVDLIGGWSYDDSTGGGVKRLNPYPNYPAGRPVLFNNFGASPDFTGASPNPRDPDTISWNLRQSQTWEVGMAQALVSVDMGWATFKSNSSYYSFDYYIDRDQDASDLDIQRLKLSSFDVQYGQEFLLQSATGNFIDWLVGANYYNHNTPDAHVPIWDRQVTADAANFFIVTPDGVPSSVFTPLNGDAIIDFRAKSTNRVWGAFGNAWVNFTDTFRFVGGLRYSDTERWFDDQSTFSIFVPPPGNPPGVAVLIPEQGPGKQHKEWDFLTWRGGFEFEPMPDSLLYLSYGRGEQAGGYNFLSVDTVEYANRLAAGETRNQATNHSTIGPFDSEKNYALEGGAKNQFLDSRLQLNLNAYYYNYKDKFITQQLASGVTQTVNAPKALVYGAELTSIYMPTDELRLNGSLGLVHSEYTRSLEGVDGTLTGECPINAPCNPADPNTDLAAPLPTKDIKGNHLARTPAVTVGLGGEYAFQLSDWGTLTPRVDWYWRDKVYFSQFNDDATAQGSYGLTNARIRIERADGSYWVELYGTNLGNADKIKTQVEGFGGNPQWWLEEPRMFGLKVGFKYF